MKKQVLLLVMALVPLIANAYDAQIDGIYYNFDNEAKTATVTYRNMNFGDNAMAYSGKVIIPSVVTYKGMDYSVTGIESYTFNGCTSVNAITIPESVTSIGSMAFNLCTNLTIITIPSSVTSIGSKIFEQCNRLFSVNITDLAAWCKIKFSSDYPPLSYADLYINGSKVENLIIPDNVTSISKYAFLSCKCIKTVTIPESVTEIGDRAFNGCSNLSSVTIGNGVTRIGAAAFCACKKLTSITIPNTVTDIGDDAFSSCDNLTSVNINDLASWCNISYGRFLNSNPLCIAHHLYLNGEEVKDLVIPNNVTSIKNFAFQGCTELNSVTFSENVTEIGEYAFNGCTGLKQVTMSKKLTSIGSHAFSGCVDLISIEIPNGVQTINYGMFSGCSSLSTVKIGNSVTTIGSESFRNCVGLTSIDFPNSVTKIEASAFAGCSGLKSLEFPQSVKQIVAGAFGGCSGLTYIKVHRNRPIAITDEFDSAFTDVDKETCILYVPKGTATMYMSAPGWMEFENIVEFEEESAINKLNVTYDTNAEWYTLDGKKLEGEPTEKGVYLYNGKKIYVK